MEKETKSGIVKIMGGLALMVLGVVGFIFGKKAKSAIVRVVILILSVLSFGAGFYLFVDGVSELAIGQIGTYKLGGPAVQGVVYKSPTDFKQKLLLSINPPPVKSTSGKLLTATLPKDTRRLHYKCNDGSKDFTVYFTPVGVINVPKKEVVCNDGTKLLAYQNK